jgi:transposase
MTTQALESTRSAGEPAKASPLAPSVVWHQLWRSGQCEHWWVVKQRASQAVQVFDRFHVQKLANEALDEVRRSEVWDVADTQAAAAVKKSRWALLKNPWNLSLCQGEKLREVQRLNQRLYRAYLLKESLAKGMDYRQPARASEHLDS